MIIESSGTYDKNYPIDLTNVKSISLIKEENLWRSMWPTGTLVLRISILDNNNNRQSVSWYYEKEILVLGEYDYLRIKKIINERKRLWFQQH
jgi:hypothetical protein